MSEAPRQAETVAEDEKRARLRLIRTPHIGSVAFFELLAQFGSAGAALDALPEFVKHGSRITSARILSAAAADAELARAASAGMRLICAGERGYPPLLAHVEAPPPLLYVKGNDAVWDLPPVAVVGSRQASAAGLKFTAEIAAALGAAGYLVVSGLARGIDSAAHRAAFPFATCAVLAGGLDEVYPAEHLDLAGEIAQKGALISECPPGFVARSQDFPRRNRIISGSCLGVVVVEATDRSGSLITARLAGEQNREVFAVPGHPYEPRAAGTNGLIKEGAVCTTSAADVENTLRPLLRAWNSDYSTSAAGNGSERKSAAQAQPAGGQKLPEALDFLGETTREILKLLSYSPVDVDELCRLSGLEIRHVQAALLALDLAGRIERRGQRQIVLKPAV